MHQFSIKYVITRVKSKLNKNNIHVSNVRSTNV